MFISVKIKKLKKAVAEIFNGKFGKADLILVEEFLEGDEMSYFIISDGLSFKSFNTAQDHKELAKVTQVKIQVVWDHMLHQNLLMQFREK